MTAEAIRKILEAHCGSGVETGKFTCDVTGPKFQLENSNIYYAECSAYPVPVAIKQCFRPGRTGLAGNEARLQFDALRKISARMAKDSRFIVPTPFDLIEDSGLVITEWISGPPLTGLLTDPRTPFAEKLNCVERAGRWLRNMHAERMLSPGPVPVDEKLDQLTAIMAESSRHLYFAKTMGKAMNALAAVATSVREGDLPRSWLHGDYKPDNVLIASDRTVGIDLALKFENCVVFDLAHFLNHLSFTCYRPNGLHLLPREPRLLAAFLNGYGNESLRAQPLALAWVRLHGVVRLWRSRTGTTPSTARAYYISWCFQRVAARLARELLRAARLD